MDGNSRLILPGASEKLRTLSQKCADNRSKEQSLKSVRDRQLTVRDYLVGEPWRDTLQGGCLQALLRHYYNANYLEIAMEKRKDPNFYRDLIENMLSKINADRQSRRRMRLRRFCEAVALVGLAAIVDRDLSLFLGGLFMSVTATLVPIVLYKNEDDCIIAERQKQFADIYNLYNGNFELFVKDLGEDLDRKAEKRLPEQSDGYA